MDVLLPAPDFDFAGKFQLSPAIQEKGGGFSKLVTMKNHPVYVETPKSGIKETIKSGKLELLFDANDSIFVDWLEKLETFCQQTFAKKNEQDGWGMEEVESLWTDSLKVYQSGKFYRLRVHVPSTTTFYLESPQLDKDLPTPPTLMEKDKLTKTDSLISILEIRGLKITPSNIRLDIILKQALIVPPDPFLEKCFVHAVQRRTPLPNPNPEPEPEPTTEPITETITEPEPETITEPTTEPTTETTTEPTTEPEPEPTTEPEPEPTTEPVAKEEFDLEKLLPNSSTKVCFDMETEMEDIFRRIQKKIGKKYTEKLNKVKQDLFGLLLESETESVSASEDLGLDLDSDFDLGVEEI
jgi:hypothetical protein